MSPSLRDHSKRIGLAVLYSFCLGALLGAGWTVLHFRGVNTIPVRPLDVAVAWTLESLRTGLLFGGIALALSLSLGTFISRQKEVRAFGRAWGHGPRAVDTAPILVLTMALGGALYTLGVVADIAPDSQGLGLRLCAVVLLAMAIGAGFRSAFKQDDIGQGRGPRFLALQPVLWMVAMLVASLKPQPLDPVGVAAAGARPNIVVVSVDGLSAFRADSVDAPINFHRLSRRGLVFQQATTPTPRGLPAMASVFTGMHPYALEQVSDHGRLPSGTETLAEILADDGYATGAFLSTLVYQRETGMGRGFRVYDDDMGAAAVASLRAPSLRLWRKLLDTMGNYKGSTHAQRSDAETLARFESWLRRHTRENVFAWVQFAGPTRPYQRHSLVGVPEQAAGILGAYRSEVDAVDALIGRVVHLLESASMLDNTVFVLMAPFGEDPGGDGHKGLGEAVVHVPLVILAPGLSRGSVDHQVRLQDLFPTLVSLSGRMEDFSYLDGKNLLPLLRGEPMPPLQAFLIVGDSSGTAVGIRTETWKYLQSPDGEELSVLDPQTWSERPPTEAQPQALEAARTGLVGLLGGARPDLPEPVPLGLERQRALEYLDARPILLP